MKTKNGKGRLAMQIFVTGLLLCTAVSGAYYEQILGTIDFASEVEDIGLPEIQEGQKLPAVPCINSTYPVDYQVLWHDSANNNITTKHQITTTLDIVEIEAIDPIIEQATTGEVEALGIDEGIPVYIYTFELSIMPGGYGDVWARMRVPTYLSDPADIIATVVISTGEEVIWEGEL